jgi:mevalonate kinase
MMECSAPAKVILFGEHAVVYGQPAIAVPVSSVRAHASVEPGRGLSINAADLGEMLTVDLEAELEHALAIMARLVLKTLDMQPPDATITIHSEIPPASGMGSGAAVATALGRTLSTILGHPLDNPILNNLVYEVEKLHHGTPSGIDNTVIVYEQPVYFVREQPIETLKIGAPFTLLIGDTGISASTRVAVADVRKLYETDHDAVQPVLDHIGNAVKNARQAIESGNTEALGDLMRENHTLLQQLTVSSPELDSLVRKAVDAGALGAKLSGGGRGGNMIALVTPETAEPVKTALLQAGAARVIMTDVR